MNFVMHATTYGPAATDTLVGIRAWSRRWVGWSRQRWRSRGRRRGRGEADLQDKVERYRVQLQADGRAATGAAREAVAGLVLLFLSGAGRARTVTVGPVAW